MKSNQVPISTISLSRAVKAALVLSALGLVVQLTLVLLFWRRLPPQIPLFYSLPVGTARLTGTFGFALVPLISLGFLGLNVVLVNILKRSSLLITQMIAWCTTLTVMMALIAMVYVLILVL